MSADDAGLDAHPDVGHVWVLTSAVLDGKGAFRAFGCDLDGCGATMVVPASGDRVRRRRRRGPASA